MKLFLLFILISTTLQARRVMVTTFDPYVNKPENGSQLAARALSQLPSTPDVEYVFCNLPVVYDLAVAKAQECYEQMNPKPDMVISTGENGCALRLESIFRNIDQSELRDNLQNIRREQTIDVNAQAYEISTLPLTDMYCAGIDPSLSKRMVASKDPGNFVCNNTAFQLNRFFKDRQIPYGFIHVPFPESEGCNVNFQEVARTMNTVIRAGIASLNRNSPEGSPLSCDIQIPFVQQVATLENVARINCENQMQIALENLPVARAPSSPDIQKENSPTVHTPKQLDP